MGDGRSIAERVEARLGERGLIDRLAGLGGSAWNSLLLEVFRRRAGRLRPADLARAYRANRFVRPATVDPVGIRSHELAWFEEAARHGFTGVELGPLAPLGTCSVVGPVDQNVVVGAGRGTEVVSDATNVLALHAAEAIRGGAGVVRACAAHRHVRAQRVDGARSFAHFAAFAMVSAGRDRGNFGFEAEEVRRHLEVLVGCLERDVQGTLELDVDVREPGFAGRLDGVLAGFEGRIAVRRGRFDTTRDYYETVRIRVYATVAGERVDLADLGFVDWTRGLVGDAKQRLLIGGAGLERVWMLSRGAG